MSKKENVNISVIMPIHELKESDKVLFKNAVKSVEEQTIKPSELVIVVPKGSEVAEYVKAYDFETISKNISIVENDGLTDFASQFNLGVSKAKSDWISMLEFDDEYAKIWFKNVVEYRKAHSDVEMFMPIVVDVDTNGQFIGFTNEAVWANSFSDTLGILDNGALLSYQNFNIDGMVIKKNVFEDLGGIKKNMKLTFIYEFMLRVTFKDVKVMVIPKFGYKHINQREGSLFHSYRETINPIEAQWWLSAAKREYFHSNDRDITYEV